MVLGRFGWFRVLVTTPQEEKNEVKVEEPPAEALNDTSLMLPQPELPVFGGDPIEHCSFIRAFESIIESRTQISSSRLYYLVQYTSGDVNELMNPDRMFQLQKKTSTYSRAEDGSLSGR